MWYKIVSQRCRLCCDSSPRGALLGIFYEGMNRVTFLVDGFNLYHSVVKAQEDNGGICVKWLNLRSMCLSFCDKVRAIVKDRAQIESIHYFSAPPTHCPPDTQSRHRFYMRCLKGSGISVHLGSFKVKWVNCRLCGRDGRHHEEKETDVAIAAKLFELCYSNEADSFVLVTGDTDLVPAIKLCRKLFPKISIFCVFPYRRVNDDLRKFSYGSFKLTRENYLTNQYPNPLRLSDGAMVTRPVEWDPSVTSIPTT
jgi:uncharacterized LabA/DUF88 family protein